MDANNHQNNEVVVRVSGVSKSFKLPHEQHAGLKQAITSILSHKRKRGFEIQDALKDISFEVKKGDFFGIVGRNGSGKSTLLKILSGIYEPSKGTVEVNGSLVPFIELGVGFNPELTGRENVFLNGALLGFTHKQVEAMYDEIVSFAELESFMDQKLKNYSSGMQVRLAFSIAIRAESDILILDEVLAVGDEAFQRKCNNYFNKILNDKNKTVILVTHNMDAINRYCNRAILIEGGDIIEKGAATDVAHAYKRMFYAEKNIRSANRWGTGELKISSPSFIGIKENKILIDTTIEGIVNKYNMVTMGYTVKNSDKQVLFGGSVNIETVPKRGNKKNVAMSFDDILGDGRYYLDLSLGLRGLDGFIDFWVDAVNFERKKNDGSREGISVRTRLF